MNETNDYGKSVGYNQAYREGYTAKYDEWSQRKNPYKEDSDEWRGFDEGYAEAVSFS